MSPILYTHLDDTVRPPDPSQVLSKPKSSPRLLNHLEGGQGEEGEKKKERKKTRLSEEPEALS